MSLTGPQVKEIDPRKCATHTSRGHGKESAASQFGADKNDALMEIVGLALGSRDSFADNGLVGPETVRAMQDDRAKIRPTESLAGQTLSRHEKLVIVDVVLNCSSSL